MAQPKSIRVFLGRKPVRPLYREGLGARPLQTVSGDEGSLSGVLGARRFQLHVICSDFWCILPQHHSEVVLVSVCLGLY